MLKEVHVAEDIKRTPLEPRTLISFNDIRAEVVEDDGGPILKVREEENPGEVIEWAWEHEGKTCKVIARPQRRKYETVCEKLTQQIYDAMDFDAFKDAVEYGLTGVRQMTNEQLIEEWRTQFGVPLEILDPEANPNAPSLEERL